MNSITTLGFVLLIGFLAKQAKAMSEVEKGAVMSKLVVVGLQCVKDYPLTLTEIKAFKNKMISDTKNSKCFAACMFKKTGVMDNMGMLSPETTRKNAEQVFKGNEESLKNVDEIMKLCSAVNQQKTSDGNMGCDRAKLAFTCLMDNAPKYGFDFDF
ncbi:uncharacterized protein LOC142977272 [Anticarsia gemmatalis]|uniref:uncharacterized protein LOC142977272 n=1 Tax=Anticarsia gemmatalis TaxID=129554 RepID=UPI003F772203